MTTNRELDEILAEAGREHRSIEAPERLEAVLFAAADSKKKAVATRRLGFTWNWAAAAILIATVAAAGTIWEIRKNREPQKQEAQTLQTPPVKVEATTPPATAAETQSVNAKPTRAGGAVRASHREGSQKRQNWNSLDEFVPLPVSEGLAPAADLSVVRIKLRGSDLQQYGLEAPADGAARTMLAEFVVGEDGLPRAIRIVR
jgi:hypothetical protein